MHKIGENFDTQLLSMNILTTINRKFLLFFGNNFFSLIYLVDNVQILFYQFELPMKVNKKLLDNFTDFF